MPTSNWSQQFAKQASTRMHRDKLNAELKRRCRQKILPIVRIARPSDYGGCIHGSFPNTYLQYCLLTDSQLDSLASFYHQDRLDGRADEYPNRMRWRTGMALEDKRREFGLFLGFRCCDDTVRPQFRGLRTAIIEVVRGLEIPHCRSPLPVPVTEIAKKASVTRRTKEIQRLVALICRIDKLQSDLSLRNSFVGAAHTATAKLDANRSPWHEKVREFNMRRSLG